MLILTETVIKEMSKNLELAIEEIDEAINFASQNDMIFAWRCETSARQMIISVIDVLTGKKP